MTQPTDPFDKAKEPRCESGAGFENSPLAPRSGDVFKSPERKNYGWICPRCGFVFAPTVPSCLRCVGKIKKEGD